MKKDSSSVYFPVLIDLRKFPCLVVGGGRVALRKVLSLLEFKATVTVVSPRFCKELIALSARGKIAIVRKKYSADRIEGHKIVFSATDNPQINRTVGADCRRAGIPLNAADNPALCDFILPAIVRRGYLTISVSSQGKAPFYTKEMKRRLNEAIPPAAGDIAELAAEFRRRLLSENNNCCRREKERAYEAFLKTDWDKFLVGKEKRQIKRIIRQILEDSRLA